MKKINQKKTHLWKKTGAVVMSGALALSMLGCEKKQETPEAASTEEVANTENLLAEYVAEGVMVPENFETMIYPLEALAVEYYSQRLPYYTEGVDDDSFWFSMGVLSTLLAEEEYVTPIMSGAYNYYTEGEMDAFASALYAEYADGKLEMPELDDENSYADYDEDLEQFGLLHGNVGYLRIYITGCTMEGDDAILDTQLLNTEADQVLAEFQMKITPNEEYGADDLFAYSVASFTVVNDVDEEAVDGPSAENDFDEVNGVEITEDDPDADFDVDDSDYPDENVEVTQKEALALAKDYLGDDSATYTYKEMVTIGEYEYYDFAVSGSSASATDVLVCVNGVDVVSGVQNEDGSWSFDQ